MGGGTTPTQPRPGQAGPPLLDLTIDNITANTVRINSQSADARLTYLMARLVTHLHDFARETRLSTDEWMGAIEFLIGCGKICSDVRNVCVLSLFLFLCGLLFWCSPFLVFLLGRGGKWGQEVKGRTWCGV
jgi:hypothetical protein